MTPKPFNKREPRTPSAPSSCGERHIPSSRGEGQKSPALKNDATGYAHLGAQAVRMWGLK